LNVPHPFGVPDSADQSFSRSTGSTLSLIQAELPRHPFEPSICSKNWTSDEASDSRPMTRHFNGRVLRDVSRPATGVTCIVAARGSAYGNHLWSAGRHEIGASCSREMHTRDGSQWRHEAGAWGQDADPISEWSGS
jgi:hypothetical protein